MKGLTVPGASAIGHPCDRKLWYGFRWASRRSIDTAIADGHRGEKTMAERLRLVPGIQLWTVDPESGGQISVVDHSGHFCGNLDGIILGLLQAPEIWLWEHKVVNDTNTAHRCK
jgi:hypothetical protein